MTKFYHKLRTSQKQVDASEQSTCEYESTLFAIWVPLLAWSHTDFQCDNLSLVEAINKGTSKDPMVMHLLRCLWFLQALFNIAIIASHIPGVQNASADMLSRNQTEKFLLKHPQSSRTPVPIPSPLVQRVSPQKLDCISLNFLQYLKQLIAITQHPPENNNYQALLNVDVCTYHTYIWTSVATG